MSIESKASKMLELPDIVARNGNVYTMSMERLRDAYGAGRLGVHVRNGIKDDLAKLGLGHYPAELPEYQEMSVRLYRKGTPAGNLIEAVLQVGSEEDAQIRSVTMGDAVITLKKIRELVCP